MRWATAVGGVILLTASLQGAGNRSPLGPVPFTSLPLGQVHPQGWLLQQCQQQRDGLTGRAEIVYASDLGSNSAWLGGTGDNWERSPYYLRGLVTLAYVLNDAGLKQNAQKWIDWLLTHQRANGYIGPASNNDWWPRMLATYALRDYYEATGDARVPGVLGNYFRYMRANLPSRPLIDWGKARAGDEMEVALWLYNQNGDTNLLSLVRLLHQQADDWTDIFSRNTFMLHGADFHPKHNVNVEQALKFPPIYYELSKQLRDLDALPLGWNNLMREDGLSCGINSGTEFLSGSASTQGVELCAIVEAMLSLETALRITGEPLLGDRLETIAFNALPASLARKIKAIQYYTLPNNVIAVYGGHGYNQDYSNGTLPGPNSGFPCCRYNFHMGWPKFVQNSWASTGDGGVAALAYGPVVVNTIVRGELVQINEETRYPYEETIRFSVAIAHPAIFPLVLRIPGWCSHALGSVNGVPERGLEAGSFHRIERRWQNGDAVVLTLPMTIKTVPGPSHSVAVIRGPLVYSLKIGEKWTVRTPDPLHHGFDEFEIHPTTPWNYALQLDSFTLAQNEIHAKARLLPDWTLGWRGTHAFEPPCSPLTSESPVATVTLVPFGKQHLRISWFPYLGNAPPPTTAFTENFDSTWSERWTVFGGNWSAQAGSLSTVPASPFGAKALATGTDFKDLIYDADVSVGPQGNAGLIFRVSKPDIGADAYCGYYAGINPNGSALEVGCASNSWNILARAPFPFKAGAVYHLKVQAQGAHLQVFVGNTPKPIVDLHDGHFSHGMIGVRDYCTDDNQSISSFSRLKAIALAR